MASEALARGVAVCVVELVKVTGDLYDWRWHVRDPRRVAPVRVRGFAALYRVEEARIRFL